MLADLPPNMDNGNRNYSVNCKSAGNGWQIQQYQDEHSNLNFPEEMTVKAWFDYWIGMKKRTVRPNTVRNYTECYERNIDPVIGKLILSEV